MNILKIYKNNQEFLTKEDIIKINLSNEKQNKLRQNTYSKNLIFNSNKNK